MTNKILEEGRAENKVKKNEYVARRGADLGISNPEMTFHYHNQNSSKAYAAKQVVDGLKRLGRQDIKDPIHKDPYHASYDSKHGVYHIKHTESGKIVDANVADSGGRALAAAAKWNFGARKGGRNTYTENTEGRALKDIVEDLKRNRGRPKKKRNLAGDIID